MPPEAATRGVLLKKVFLKILQNSQKNTCARVSFLIKLQALRLQFFKKRLWHRCFPATFAKFLRATFLQNTSGRLLLCRVIQVMKDTGFVKKLYITVYINFNFSLLNFLTFLTLLVAFSFLR